MIKKLTFVLALFASVTAVEMTGMGYTGTVCVAAPHAPNNGSYLKTYNTVEVYAESGHHKGTYSVYLHHGKRYIDFHNTWVCIQGKRRFGFQGNWYIIK